MSRLSISVRCARAGSRSASPCSADGLRVRRAAGDRLGRDLARDAVHAAALGLRDRGRADLRPRRQARGRSRPAARSTSRPAAREHRFEAPGLPSSPASSRSSPTLDVSDERLAAQRFRARLAGRGRDRDDRAGHRDPEGPGRPDPDRDLADVVLPHDPGPDGERSGYTTGWCDAPHWGLVTAGRMAIEWEDDVEILSSGRHLPLPGRPARPPARGGGSGDVRGPDADRGARRRRATGRVAPRRGPSTAGRPRAGSRWPRSV